MATTILGLIGNLTRCCVRRCSACALLMWATAAEVLALQAHRDRQDQPVHRVRPERPACKDRQGRSVRRVCQALLGQPDLRGSKVRKDPLGQPVHKARKAILDHRVLPVRKAHKVCKDLKVRRDHKV